MAARTAFGQTRVPHLPKRRCAYLDHGTPLASDQIHHVLDFPTVCQRFQQEEKKERATRANEIRRRVTYELISPFGPLSLGHATHVRGCLRLLAVYRAVLPITKTIGVGANVWI